MEADNEEGGGRDGHLGGGDVCQIPLRGGRQRGRDGHVQRGDVRQVPTMGACNLWGLGEDKDNHSAEGCQDSSPPQRQ